MSDVKDKAKIKCELDSAMVHSIEIHLSKHHPGVTLADYQAQFPGAPILSEVAKDAVRLARAKKAQEKAAAGPRQPLTDIFGFDPKNVTNTQGKVMECRVYERSDYDSDSLVWLPRIDPDYIFDVDLTKIALMALELN
jgi:cobaltochelatase CobS